MKRLVKPYINLLPCCLLLLLLAACSSDAPSSPTGGEGDGVVRFNVGFAASTRVMVNPYNFKCDWTEYDAIGVYVVKRKSSEPKALSSTPGENFRNNVKVYMKDDFTWAYGDEEEPIIFPNDGDVLDFYAYYPYNPAITDTDPNAVTFAVEIDQSTNVGANMLMRAKAAGIERAGATAVTLQFSHLMAMVQITSKSALDSNVAKQINTAVHFNLNDGTTTPVANQVPKDIRMFSTDSQVWQMIVPAEQTTSRFVLSVIEFPYSTVCTATVAKTLTAGTVTAFNVFPGFIGIGTKEDLIKLSKAESGYPPNGKYVQTADIDLTGEEWTPSQGGQFGGEYDGNGYAINYLTITQANTNGSQHGLFYASSNGKFSNITLNNVRIDAADGAHYVGALIGQAMGCEIINCRVVDGEIKGSQGVGGLVGSASNTTITACYVQDCQIGSATGNYVGGFIGIESVTCPITQGYCVGNTVTASSDYGTFIGMPDTTNPSGATPAECYSDVAGDSQSTTFGATAWPAESSWMLSSAGGSWKSLGGWNSGTPVYPSLWYE
jgi:hypothetical protein